MATLQLTNVDDFFAPTPICIKPELDAKASQHSKEKKDEGSEPLAHGKRKRGLGPAVMLELEEDMGKPSASTGHFDQIKLSISKTAKITLNDCLACSGCVTSAETVLITAQSTQEFLSRLPVRPTEAEAEVKVPPPSSMVVVTVSPQARASIAHFFKVTQIQAAKKLVSFFKGLGATHVLDASCALDLALVEARAEFLARVRAKSGPLLASECPGWVCYAEKKQHNVLPMMSTVKSPQQLMGTIVKRILAPRWGLRADQIYHATVMPCFDKKLEGSRTEFTIAAGPGAEAMTREVDCVLTANEIKELIQDRGVDFANLPEPDLDSEFYEVSADGQNLVSALDVGGSGGYAENVFRHAALSLFGTSPPQNLEYKTIRNADCKEIKLEVDGQTVLTFATVYGFRNVGPLMKKLQAGSPQSYQYVEIMACPAGCLNGGGQIRSAGGSISSQRALVRALDDLYHNPNQIKRRDPASSPFVERVYKDLVSSGLGSGLIDDIGPGSTAARALFHTSFSAVASADTGLMTRW